MNKNYLYIGAGIIVVLLFAFVGIWFFFLRPSASLQSTSSTNTFGVATNNSTNVSTTNTSGATNNTQAVTQNGEQVSTQKIFELAQGPVVGATFIQTQNPTTTLARYIDQDDGHVYDLPVDVAGAIPQVVSDITIPGGVRALWAQGGNAAIMQYLDANSVVKTVYLGFSAASTSVQTSATKIQFLPDNIGDIAVSPDGKNVAYLLATANGADGYLAGADGTGSKKLFSLPLSQLLISWPAQSTLLVQSKSAAGVPGIAFSVNAKTGAVIPLIYAQGLTAIADPLFTNVVYQTNSGESVTSYDHNIKTGLNVPLDFTPYPEQCIWSLTASTTMYCSSPLQYVDPSYLDQFHQGLVSVGNALFSFNLSVDQATIVTVPGGKDGGVSSDISEMSLSPDEHYLEYVTKGDRALWGVRLSQ